MGLSVDVLVVVSYVRAAGTTALLASLSVNWIEAAFMALLHVAVTFIDGGTPVLPGPGLRVVMVGAWVSRAKTTSTQ